MRNPLTKRYPRELRNNLGKYLGLFLMMVFAVSFTSGFLLAASSIETIVGDMKQTYRIEDGRFSCDFEPDDEALDAVRKLGVTLYEDFWKQVDLDLKGGDGATDITARVYANRAMVDLAAYAEGRAPKAADEIALDRVFCENHGLAVGDSVMVGGNEATITGIMTLPDYQALFEDNGSFMFNAITFTVAQVSKEGYDAFGGSGEVFNYAYVFEDEGLLATERSDVEEDMIDALADNDAQLKDFIDADDNQGIGYALDDVQGDQTMWTVLLFMLVVIMAFVFVVLTGTTIEQESSVIGTMLASGWRKRELVVHYLLPPAVIGLIACAVGLALGVNVLSNPFQGLYYHSYSLPPFHTIWNPRVVVLTTVVPYILLVGITGLGLVRSLRFTPLQFLRHEASARRRRGLMRLPDALRYATRFRLRVLMCNASHFATLFLGILFASLLLLFGLCMLPVVDNYAQALRQTVVAPHQYVLKTPVELTGSRKDIERYAAALRLADDHGRIERNQDAVDALERLEDNDELVNALERLQDNDKLMDALDRLEKNDALMDAIDRLRKRQDLLDAAERLKDNQKLIDAIDRLEKHQDILDAAERLENRQDLLDAAERLQGQEELVEAAERLQSRADLVAAAERLQARQDLVVAAERLQAQPELVAAAERLQSKQELVAAAERLQTKPSIVAAAQHAQEGTATPEELALLAGLDAQTKADLELVSTMDEQTRADMELVATMDEQTKADLQIVAGIDDQTRLDMELLQTMDDQTQRDMELVAGMDEQTRRDMELIANVDDRTRDDLELLANVDDQTRDDLETIGDVDDQTRDDLELISDADEQTRADFDLITDLDEKTRADMELITDAKGQTKKDLELLMDLDDATRDDVELIRDMDEDLVDDLRLASEIDEDAHVVNTQKNSPEVIAAAEKYALGSVDVERAFGGEFETISVYGIVPGSAYWTGMPVADGKAVAGHGLVEKTKAEVGETVVLHDVRKGRDFEVFVADQTSNAADTAIYLTLDDFNRLFENDADYFNAYASADELRLDGRYVASSIVPGDMDDISTQMRESMGDIMYMMMLMAVPIYLVIMYLLTKTVIDRSARSISYMKVFGYHSREVDGLYIRPITTFVFVSLVASIPLIIGLMTLLLTLVFMSYEGNFPIVIPNDRLAMLVLAGMAVYALMAVLHVRRIRSVPLALALKVQE